MPFFLTFDYKDQLYIALLSIFIHFFGFLCLVFLALIMKSLETCKADDAHVYIVVCIHLEK